MHSPEQREETRRPRHPSRSRKLRIVFCLLHEGYIRNFEGVVRELASRGHEVRIAFDRPASRWEAERELARSLARETGKVRVVDGPGRTDGSRQRLARNLRLGLDYLRYFGPEYENAPKLRRRAARDAPPVLRWLALHLPSRAFRRILERALAGIESRLPSDPLIDGFLEQHDPDIVLLTPLVALGSDQADYAWSAARKGIPCGLLVASWDNLTNKGRIRAPLELTAVWNEAQRREAIDLHRLDPETVVATGAHCYDHWFGWQPSTTREEFCRRVGLPGDRPYLLYVCSSRFIAPRERPFVLAWAAHLRRAEAPVRELGILVRPHPQNDEQWEANGRDAPDAFAVFPVRGETPVGTGARRDYFDSIYHAAAVVGINTSALIESGIVGRPVHTITTDEWGESQRGTLHFSHLADGTAPLVIEARSLEEHVRQLQLLFRQDSEEWALRNRRFLEEFVRPHGLSRPAAPMLADAVEQAATKTVQRTDALHHGRMRALTPILRLLLVDASTLRRPGQVARWLRNGGWRVVLRRLGERGIEGRGKRPQ